MNYFIDGDFDVEYLKTGKNKLTSCSYSNTSDTFTNIILDSAVQNNINLRTFNEISEFKNQFESSFNKVYSSTGIDIWFLAQFRVYFEYRNFHLKVASILQFLELNKEGVVVTSDVRMKQFIPVEKLEIVNETTRKSKNYGNLLKEFFYTLSFFKFRNIYKLKRKNYLLISNLKDQINGHDKRFGKVENHCDKLIVREQFNPKNKLPSNRKRGQKNELSIEELTARYLLNPSWLSHVFKFNKAIKLLIGNIYKNEDLSNNQKVIADLFFINKFSYFIFFIRYRTFEKYFRKANYKKVLFIDENSPQLRGVQHAAKQNNVKTLALQHGNIHDLHPAYIFGEYNSIPLLPDVTFSWGAYFTKLLIKKGGYSKNKVITTGRIKPLLDGRKIHKDIDKTKKISVFATQPQRDKMLRRKIFIDVLETFADFGTDYQLVIRPHPAEISDDFFIECAKEVGFNDFLIDRESDLVTHFEICSILMTSFSTVGVEFTPYYKPLIVLDYLKSDLIGYVKAGVGIGIHNKFQLKEILTNKELTINKVKFEKFIENYLYKNGEEAIDLIVNVIHEK